MTMLLYLFVILHLILNLGKEKRIHQVSTKGAYYIIMFLHSYNYCCIKSDSILALTVIIKFILNLNNYYLICNSYCPM